jgi:hypothetical protein
MAMVHVEVQWDGRFGRLDGGGGGGWSWEKLFTDTRPFRLCFSTGVTQRPEWDFEAFPFGNQMSVSL